MTIHTQARLFVSAWLLMGSAMADHFDPSAIAGVTGTYLGNDGGSYFMRVLPNGRFFWYGEHPSGRFSNVMVGNLERAEGALTGNVNGAWADVPKAAIRGGDLSPFAIKLLLNQPRRHEISKAAETGVDFGGTHWRHTAVAKAPRVVGYGDAPIPGSLTGVWLANAGGTYYLRQMGNDVIWFGAGCQDGRNTNTDFSNVFLGRLTGTTLSGIWADVPYGSAGGDGALTLSAEGGVLRRTGTTGGFGENSWVRMSSLMGSPVLQLNISFTTGGDDLREGSRVTGSLANATGPIRVALLNGRRGATPFGLPSGATGETTFTLPMGTTLGSLQSSVFVMTLASTNTSLDQDNWDVAAVRITATLSSGRSICLLNTAGSEFRLTGSAPSRSLALPAL